MGERVTNSPTPAQITALLDSAGLTAYAAGPMIRINARQLQRAIAGAGKLHPSTWLLLQVTLSASERAKMPEPVAP